MQRRETWQPPCVSGCGRGSSPCPPGGLVLPCASAMATAARPRPSLGHDQRRRPGAQAHRRVTSRKEADDSLGTVHGPCICSQSGAKCCQVFLLPLCPLSLAHFSNNASSRSSFSSYCSASAFSRSWHAWQPSCVHPSATEAPHSATMHRPLQPRTSEASLAAHDAQCVGRSRLEPTAPCVAYAPHLPVRCGPAGTT